MKRLLILALVAAAAWYGYKHYPELLNKAGKNELRVQNHSGHPMERIRAVIDGQALVIESLERDAERTLPFDVAKDSDVDLTYQYSDLMGERHWRGGSVMAAAIKHQYVIEFTADMDVVFSMQSK